MDSSIFVKFCRRLQSVAKLFRFVELCICLMFLSWLSSRLPFAVKISGEYFRRTAVLMLSPVSIFLLGNAIVVTLLAKSGLFSGNASLSIDNAVAEFCDELRSTCPHETSSPSDKDEVIYQDKEIICEGNATTTKLQLFINDAPKKEVAVVPAAEEVEKKVSFRRSKSENSRRESEGIGEEEGVKKEKLRRSETDVCRRNVEDELVGGDDGEEFRKTIEAFIAKQVKFHRQESLAVVLHGQS